MEKEIIEAQLEQLASGHDLGELDDFVRQLSQPELIVNKAAVVDSYLALYHVALFDLDCDRIRDVDKEDFVSFLFEILSSLEKIYPDQVQYTLKAVCYKYLSSLKTDSAGKLSNIQKAIDEDTLALQHDDDVRLNADLANALLERMMLTKQFEAKGLTEILQLFTIAFSSYSEEVLNNFLQASFRLLGLSFPSSQKWHGIFMDQFNTLASGFAQKDSFIYLKWSDSLFKILEYSEGGIADDYAQKTTNHAIELLECVADYQTDNTEQLNQLGRSFEKVAENFGSDLRLEKLRFHKVAFDFFARAHAINPAAWTFSVYATNELLSMARIRKGEYDQAKLIELFEGGLKFFSTTFEYEHGITLSLRWGEYLLEYARLAYDFKSPEILEKAESIFLHAKQVGEGHYTAPFVGLAKVALKLGDRQRCLAILQECKSVMKSISLDYKFENILTDSDFKEIWPELAG